MNIALIGYGKMGRAIEAIAVDRGHQIVLKIDVDNLNDLTRENLQKAQVAIEFTNPEMAYANVTRCIEYDVPVVSGSTGWYDRLDEVKYLCNERNGSMLCTSNFSLGVNIFFEINRYLARIMNNFPDYRIEMEETHHAQKLDAPSGTAITLAEGIIGEVSRVKQWKPDGESRIDVIPIHSVRRDSVPGTHNVKYTSEIDNIEIIHTAYSRKGLALGAVLAAEYIYDKKGIFSMKDFLKISEV